MTTKAQLPVDAEPFIWRNQYDWSRDKLVRAATNIRCEEGSSMTMQSFKDDADINLIMARFGVTDGAIPPAAIDPKYFGDFTEAVDFRTALDNTREAAERFNQLPANIRAKFENDPYQLWTWVNDQANAEEAVTLGLLAKTPEPPAPKETPKQ